VLERLRPKSISVKTSPVVRRKGRRGREKKVVEEVVEKVVKEVVEKVVKEVIEKVVRKEC
jgi:hypothetical protein